MRPITDRFARALRGPHLIATQCDLWFPGETVPVTVPIEDGTVTIDRTAMIRRTGQVQIPWALEAGADLGVDVRDLPYGGYCDLYRGLQFPGSATTYAAVKATYATYAALQAAKASYADMLTGSASAVELCQLGHFRIESVTWGTTSRSASLELADRMAQIRDEPFTSPYVTPAGTTVARTGTLTDGSAVITGLSKTSDLLVGVAVSGPGIPAGRTILSINSSSQITLNGPAQIDVTLGYTYTSGSPVVTVTPDTSDLSVGMTFLGRTITSIPSSSQIVLSSPMGNGLIAIKTGTATHGSSQITALPSTSDLAVGDEVHGPSAQTVQVPNGTTILSILSASQITVTKAAGGGFTGLSSTGSMSFYRAGTYSASGAHATLAATQTLTFGVGTRVAAAAKDIADDVFGSTISYLLLYDPAVTLGDVAFAGSRSDAIQQLAQAVAADVYFDATGAFVFTTQPGDTSPAYVIDTGAAGVLVDSDESLARTGVYNGVIVTGQAAGTDPPVTALVTNNDSGSPLLWGGPFGKVLRVETSSAVQTTGQATDAATALLNQRAGLSRSLTLSAAPNPALEAGDVITVDFGDGRVETHLIDSVHLGLTAAGEQSLAVRLVDSVSALTVPMATQPRILYGDDAWAEARTARLVRVGA